MNGPIENNVIPFPYLAKRLLEKGKAYIENGNISEGIEMVIEANNMKNDDPEILTVLAAAYCKQGQFKKAKLITEDLLYLEKTDYLQVMDFYISILFQLQEYKKIRRMLKMVLEENELPEYKMNQYVELIHLSKKMIEETDSGGLIKKIDLSAVNPLESIEALSEMDRDELMDLLPDIREYLKQEDKDPFTKTVLLNRLNEVQLDENFIVSKYDKILEFNPMEYDPPGMVHFVKEVKNKIEEMYLQKNPTMNEYAVTLADRFFFHIFPLESQFQNEELWAKAIVSVVLQYMGDEKAALSWDEDMERAIQFILRVEHSFRL